MVRQLLRIEALAKKDYYSVKLDILKDLRYMQDMRGRDYEHI